LKVEKITDQQTVAETCNEYFVAMAEDVKRQSQNNLLNDGNNSIDNHTHFMEQAFNKTYPSMECKCTTTKETDKL
jgi:acyl carrier protein phosphodiesterase